MAASELLEHKQALRIFTKQNCYEINFSTNLTSFDIKCREECMRSEKHLRASVQNSNMNIKSNYIIVGDCLEFEVSLCIVQVASK